MIALFVLLFWCSGSGSSSGRCRGGTLLPTAATNSTLPANTTPTLLSKTRQQHRQPDAEAADLEAGIAKAHAALKQLEADAMGVMTKLEELQAAKQAADAALEAARAAREAKQRELGVIKGVRVEIEAALEKLKGAKRESAAAAKQLEKALAADAEKLREYTGARGLRM